MNLIERRREMAGVIGEKPPTLIPYIRGGADGSYIDTGIIPDNTTRVIVWARNFNPATNYTWLFGSREAGRTEQFGVYACITARTGQIGGMYASEFFYTGDAFSLMSGYHKYELNGNVFSVDDTVVATATAATITSSKPIYLLGMNNDNTLASPVSPIDICACQIYKNGVLVGDFTAVDFPSVGLYDAVSGSLFTNAGSGSFTYGTFNPNVYTPLKYISCTNAQYFDTGIYGTKSLPAVVKFQIRGTTLSYPNIFGTMRSGTSGTYFLLQGGNSTYKNRYMNFYIDGTTNNQIYNSNSTKLTSLDVVFVKDATTARLVRNGTTFGTSKTFTADSSFSTSPDTIALATTYTSGAFNTAGAFNGYIYYAGFGAERNFIPVSYNGVGGMWDTYHDVFYPSTSGVNFIKGNYLNPQYEYEDGMQVVRHWEAEDEVISNIWQDRVWLTNITLTSATKGSGYWQFTNSSTTSATSYGTFASWLGNLGYHWKVVADIAIKYNSSANLIALDFGSVQGTNDGTQAFEIGLTSEKKWTFNTKFNGNSGAATYAPNATNLTETDISNGDWVRRTVTIGVRASETEGMDETYAIVKGLGTGVSAPFTPINFNNWMTGWYIGRSAITPASNYPYASTVRIYSLKVYKEI